MCLWTSFKWYLYKPKLHANWKLKEKQFNSLLAPTFSMSCLTLFIWFLRTDTSWPKDSTSLSTRGRLPTTCNTAQSQENGCNKCISIFPPYSLVSSYFPLIPFLCILDTKLYKKMQVRWTVTLTWWLVSSRALFTSWMASCNRITKDDAYCCTNTTQITIKTFELGMLHVTHNVTNL